MIYVTVKSETKQGLFFKKFSQRAELEIMEGYGKYSKTEPEFSQTKRHFL